jgi:hypothetical protein
MRRLLLIGLASLCACHWYRFPSAVSRDEVDELYSGAAEDLGCPEDEIESRPRTLFTRLVEGCGHQRVYAYDPMLEQWVVEVVEKP